MVTLTFGTMTLTMRNPEMGNTDSLEFTRISRSTTGGDNILYRDPQWPKIEKLNVTFDHCGPTEMEALKVLLKIALGKQITYVDQDGLTWSVLVLNPNTSIKQPRKNGYVVQLELEAEPV